jgi:hypothetical protein
MPGYLRRPVRPGVPPGIGILPGAGFLLDAAFLLGAGLLLGACTAADYPYFLRGAGSLEITATADNTFQLFLDGRELAHETDPWTFEKTFTVSESVSAGSHVVAARATNIHAGTPQGFIAEVRLEGNLLPGAATPGDWFVTDEEPTTDWTERGFRRDDTWSAVKTGEACSSGMWPTHEELQPGASWVWSDCGGPDTVNWFRFEFDLGG